MVCIYTFHGEAPQPPGGLSAGFDPVNATQTDRTCRTTPLKVAYLLDEVIFPAESKNSLRLAYFTQPQVLSLIYPPHPSTEKLKVSCRAADCRIFREDDMLQITMPLAKCQYSRAGPDPKAVYHHSSTLRKWVLSLAVGNELVIECTVLGNSADEEGSSARLAHQFAEHVKVASSGKPPQVIPPRGNAKNVGIVESGKKMDVGAETPRYMRAWREV